MSGFATGGVQKPLLYARVRIDGLNAKPEYNGRYGKAITFVEETGRYGVRLEGGQTDEVIALKAANLTLANSVDEGGEPCAHCGKLGAALRCRVCFSVSFCDESCATKGAPAHKGECKAPPIGPMRGVTHTVEGVESMTQHLEASMRAGAAGSADQEIRMLKQAVAADPMQPSAWFNLAMAYKDKGARREAVGAMDRAVFSLLAVSEPGAVELPPGGMAQIEEMMTNFVGKGGKLLEEASHGIPGDLELKGSLALRLIELKDRCRDKVSPNDRSLVHYVYAEVLRKGDDVEGALAQYHLAAAAARPQCDALSLMIIPEMHARLAATQHAARSDGQRRGMKTAANAAKTGLAEARPFSPNKADAKILSFEMTYVRMVGNLMMTHCDQAGRLQVDSQGDVDEIVQHAKEVLPYAKRHAKRGGREGAQAQQLLPNIEALIEGTCPTSVPVS